MRGHTDGHGSAHMKNTGPLPWGERVHNAARWALSVLPYVEKHRTSCRFFCSRRGNAEKECFWAHSGFRPFWSKPGATQPPTHPPGRHPPTRAPPTHPPTHPGATNLFGHIRASAQFGPNSQNAENECFGAHSGFSPIWSEQPECRKGMFLGTVGLQPNLVRIAGMLKRNVFGHLRASGQFGPNRAPPDHPPTHPGATHRGATHPPTHPPTRAPRMFLGTFGLQPNLVRTAGMPKTNVFGHIQASAQFGPNSRNAEDECFWVPSGFRPIWSEQPECRKRMFLGTFRFQANLVQTGRHPPTHPPTHPGATNPPIHPGATHPPTHPPWLHDSFWAHSGFSPIWSEEPEC